MLIFGVSLVLELHPHWAVVKLDLRNAFNEIKRAAVLARINAAEALRDLAPLTWSTYAPANGVYLAQQGTTQAGYASEEGVHQGDPLASAQFCAGIHPEVCQLDAELQVAGGAACFDMDDGYAVGPVEQVFPAILRFAARIHALGLELQLHKCKCYSPATDLSCHVARPPAVVVGTELLQSGPVRGVVVCGVPLGEADFISHHLDCKVEEAMSTITTISTKLRDRHLQALWSVTYHCIQTKFQYWAQHCPPTVVQNAAAKFDAAILEVAATCIGNNIRQDPLTLRRLRLPARMYGGGLRSVVDTTPAAFIGTICRTVPFFADRIVDGRLVRGFMPVLTRALGGATDESQDNGARLDAFTVSGSHTAQVFNECVRRLQISAGNSGSDSLQTVIRNVICERKGVQKTCTKWIERACFQSLDVE